MKRQGENIQKESAATRSSTEFRKCQEAYEAIIKKGTALGDMELLGAEDKAEFVRLSQMINEWEAAHHPLPGRVSTLITDAIKERMKAENLRQKEVAKSLGISESRISDLLNGR